MPGKPTFDDYFLASVGDRVRLAVLDAVLWVNGPTPEDTAWRALSGTRAELMLNSGSPAEALEAASMKLCDPNLRPRHFNPLCTAGVADLNPESPEAVLALSADSEAWVKRGGAWESLWPDDMLTLESRAAWEESTQELTRSQDLHVHQERLLEERSAWAWPSIGLFPELEVRGGKVYNIEELILSTDGAKLTKERCEDIEGWLTGGLQIRPEGSKHPSPHGDVTVVHATFS